MNRYSIRTASQYLHLNTNKVIQRAHTLGITTRSGLTADDIRRIGAFKEPNRNRNQRSTLEELKKEMEKTCHE